MAVRAEFKNAQLGDARLTARLVDIAGALAGRPAESFPRAMGSEAELEGFYRFVRNEKVCLRNTLAPHTACTVKRAAARDAILVVHDTSEFRFSGACRRSGLGRLGTSGQGFLGHLSLAVAADDTREPLGVLATQIVRRTQKSVTKRLESGALTRGQARNAEGRESERWVAGVDGAEAVVGGATSLIHVMDSEGDHYEMLSALIGAERRFVIRLGQDRRVDGDEPMNVQEFLDRRGAETLATRTVQLARRSRPINRLQLRQCARVERDARLAIAATPLTIRRPRNNARATFPKTLDLHAVVVREVDPPKDVEPVEWILLTTEPVGSADEALRVVDFYRTRWIIEEYFKALKTGCALEKRQLETWDTLQVALAIFIPIAWHMLRLRFLSRHAPDERASTILSATQLEVLHRHPNVQLPHAATVHAALLAVARLGGHIKNNGEPGWLVLARGYDELLRLVAGYRLASQKCDQ